MIFKLDITSDSRKVPYKDSTQIDHLKSYILHNAYSLDYDELIIVMNELVDAYIESGYGLAIRGERCHPNHYEGLENRLTTIMVRDYRYNDIIQIPKNDLLYLALFFIFSLPQEVWERYNFPVVVYPKRSVRYGTEEILGNEIALVFYALTRYGGGSSFFDKLRNRWIFDIENGELHQ